MTYKIETNIPMPSGGRGRGKSEFRLVVEQMEIGNSVVCTEGDRKQIHQIAASIGIEYKCRKIDVNQYRVWRTA